ncbi:MAG TPA: hypothetical protein PKJ68_04035 [Candidatus Woesebacteria bacterium]|nr:hypothetical protein [Candidatus Woesebacteria bacterium]
MIITLPVSRLSKKMLLSEYPCDERTALIKAGAHTLLCRQLRMKYRDKYQHLRTHELLVDSVKISAPQMPPLSDAARAMIGYMVHQEHRMSIMRWIESAVILGHTASEGIRTFFERYDLDDDDLNYESVFRQWQRHKRRIMQDVSEDDLAAVRNFAKENPPPPTLEDQERRFQIFISRITDHLYDSRQMWRRGQVRNLRLYMRSRSERIDDLAVEYGIHASNVYRAVQQAQRWISERRIVREAAAALINV